MTCYLKGMRDAVSGVAGQGTQRERQIVYLATACAPRGGGKND
jgi:hypothetical protein